MLTINSFTLRRAAATALAAGLLLTACGGDDADATPHEALADQIVDGIGAIRGLSVDSDCVAAKVDELTDDQVATMSAALNNGEEPPADLVDWNVAIGDECVSIDE